MPAKIIKIIALLAVALYLISAAFLFVTQRSFLYFPTAKYPHSLPIEQFSNDGELIDVILLNGGEEKAIIYFAGNAESVAHSAPSFAEVFPNHSLYLVNYRGYGGSTGSPSEKAFYSDALYIYDSLAKRHSSVSVIGRSIGTGVATFLASNRTIEKMALITPYDSIQRIAQDRYPIFPINMLLKDKFDSIGRVAQITAETLIILAEQDSVIPARYSARLIAAFPEQQLSTKTILAAGHDSLTNTQEYYFLLQNFMP